MFDCIIIGAGIIGLTLARQFSLAGYHTIVLEANPEIGHETSFRNSAVIHAGIYYPSNSLKASLCVQGKSLLKDYCNAHQIPYKKIGKLIVANQAAQQNQLLQLQNQAIKNGVRNLHFIDQTTLRTIEPAVQGVGALFSPDTATIDGQKLIQSLKNEFLSKGGQILTNTFVEGCQIINNHFMVQTRHPLHHSLKSYWLINAAGLGAQRLAHHIEGMPTHLIPPLYLAKGNYFKYNQKSPFQHLIYPLPESAGLGIHATLDVHDQLRFGPDVEWVQGINFKTNLSRKATFISAIKLYYPELNEAALHPDDAHTGIRPKIQPREEQPQDFMIQTENSHGIKGLVNLYGIESPGLTASFSMAHYIFECVMQSERIIL